MEERKFVDIEEVKDVLGDTINSEGDYHHALRLLNGLSSVTEQDIVKPILDKIKTEIAFEVDHRTNMLCAEDVFAILDRYNTESEDK